jgi:hypothetical protein
MSKLMVEFSRLTVEDKAVEEAAAPETPAKEPADAKVNIYAFPIPEADFAQYSADKKNAANEFKGYVQDVMPKLVELIAKEGATKHVGVCTADVASRMLPTSKAFDEFVTPACAEFKDDTPENLLAAIKTATAQLADILKKDPELVASGKDNSPAFKLAAETVVKARALYMKAPK